MKFALDSVVQLVGHHPFNQKLVTGIPGQGACLGFSGSFPNRGRARAADQCFSFTSTPLSLSLPFPSSVSKSQFKKTFFSKSHNLTRSTVQKYFFPLGPFLSHSFVTIPHAIILFF